MFIDMLHFSIFISTFMLATLTMIQWLINMTQSSEKVILVYLFLNQHKQQHTTTYHLPSVST